MTKSIQSLPLLYGSMLVGLSLNDDDVDKSVYIYLMNACLGEILIFASQISSIIFGVS